MEQFWKHGKMLRLADITKHPAKATRKWLEDKKVDVVEWPSHKTDLNLREDLWQDLKGAVHI